MFGAKWKVGNPSQTFLAPCFADSVVAPEHRGHGLYKKLSIERLKELFKSSYTYNFVLSANPISCANLMKMGWRSIGSIQRMRWQAEQTTFSGQVLRYAAKLSPVHPTKTNGPFYFLDNSAAEHRTKSPNVSIEHAPRPEAMAEFIDRIGYDGRIRHVRDREFFSWRFNNPLFRYRFLFWEESRLEGYLILQAKFNSDMSSAKIVDWEATNARFQSDLIDAALRLGEFDSLRIWTGTLSDAVKVILEKNGFRVLDQEKSKTHYRPTVLVRPVRDDMLETDWTLEGRRLLDLSNWDLRMIYSDGS
jgi:hypothetical protein